MTSVLKECKSVLNKFWTFLKRKCAATLSVIQNQTITMLAFSVAISCSHFCCESYLAFHILYWILFFCYLKFCLLSDLQILDALDIDPHCKKMHLAHKLENVACTLEGEETSTC